MDMGRRMNGLSDLPDNLLERKKWWQGWAGLLNVSLVATFVLFFLLYIIDQRHHLAELFSLSPASLAGLFLLAWGVIGTFGLINFIVFRRINCPVTLSEGMTLAVVNTLGNLLPFSGGLIGKGIYLKQRHQLSYQSYLSATVALYIIFIVANGLAGSLTLAYLGITDSWPAWYLFVGFTGLVFPVVLFFLPITRLVPRRLRKIVNNAHSGWGVISDSFSTITVIIVVRLAGTFLSAGRLWLLFHAFSQTIGFSHCIVFVSGAILTRLVSVTPGGLGIREVIVGGLSAALGFPFGMAVIVTAADRLFEVLGAGIMALLFWPRRKVDTPDEKFRLS